MRPGPALEGAPGPVAVGARISIWLGGECIAPSIDCEDVKLEDTRDRKTRARVTWLSPRAMTPVDPQDPLNNFGQVAHVTALLRIGGHVHEVPMGRYLVTDWAESERGVTVTAVGLLQVLEDDPAPWGSSPPPGATLESELVRLSPHLPIILDYGCPNPGMPTSAQWPAKRAEAVAEVCASAGVEYGIGVDGAIHVWAPRGRRDVAATYTARDLLVGGLRKSRDRLPNRVHAVGTASGGKAQEKWLSTVDLGEHTVYDPRSYGRVTKIIDVSGASGRSSVWAAADAEARRTLEATETRSLAIVSDPRLELGDVIAAHVPGETEPIVGRVTAYAVTLDSASTEMRIDVEVLRW